MLRLRGWDRELPADGAGGSFGYLAVTRHGRAEIASLVVPDAVPRAFAQQGATVVGQVMLELASFQAAARSIVIGST